MAEPKTRPTDADVGAFLDAVEDETKRADCRTLVKMMRRITRARPRMWGDAIIGFGRYRYVYDSGRTGEWFLTGFSPRKQALTLYVMSGFRDAEPLLERLGRHETGKACLYIKRLADVDLDVLAELIARSVAALRQRERA